MQHIQHHTLQQQQQKFQHNSISFGFVYHICAKKKKQNIYNFYIKTGEFFTRFSKVKSSLLIVYILNSFSSSLSNQIYISFLNLTTKKCIKYKNLFQFF